MKRIATVLTLAALAVGCAEVGEDRTPEVGPLATPSPSPGGGATLTLVAAPEGPLARLRGGGQEVEVDAHTSCWDSPGVSTCVDGFPTEPEAYVEVRRGGTLTVSGDAETVEVGVARFRPGDVAAELQVVQDLPLEDGSATIDVEPGRYLLQVFATFEEGDGAFALGLRVL
ncbi:MAG TPA: hypothetical protein VF097_00505 [Actinomycetota bacterium]